ncbi:hypothetical protein Tco_0762549 [Tanacetum coccineum]
MSLSWIATLAIRVGRPKKKRKRSKHEDEPFVKDGKLSKKERTITCQSCETLDTIRKHAKDKVESGNNAEPSGLSAAGGQDGSGGAGVGVGSQGSSYSRWTKIRGKSMMPVDKDMYHKKVTPLAKAIMVMARKLLQLKNVELDKGKSMMPVEDDMDWYTDEMREHATKIAE